MFALKEGTAEFVREFPFLDAVLSVGLETVLIDDFDSCAEELRLALLQKASCLEIIGVHSHTRLAKLGCLDSKLRLLRY